MSTQVRFSNMQRLTALSITAGSEGQHGRTVLSGQNESALKGLLTVCSWCAKAKIDAEWVDIQSPSRGFDLFTRDPIAQRTHGICSSCAVDVMAEDD